MAMSKAAQKPKTAVGRDYNALAPGGEAFHSSVFAAHRQEAPWTGTSLLRVPQLITPSPRSRKGEAL